MVKFPEVEVQLSGEDGNVFFIISRVARALKRSGHGPDAVLFQNQAMQCGSYEEVIKLAGETVTIS